MKYACKCKFYISVVNFFLKFGSYEKKPMFSVKKKKVRYETLISFYSVILHHPFVGFFFGLVLFVSLFVCFLNTGLLSD